MCDVRPSLTYYGLQLLCLRRKERSLATVLGYVELIGFDPWPYVDQTSHFTTSSRSGWPRQSLAASLNSDVISLRR